MKTNKRGMGALMIIRMRGRLWRYAQKELRDSWRVAISKGRALMPECSHEWR